MKINVPEIAFIHKRQNWVYMKKVLLDQLVQQISRGNPQAALKLQKVEVVWGNVANIVNNEEWVVEVENIRGMFRIPGMDPDIINATGRMARCGEVFRARAFIWSYIKVISRLLAIT